VKDAAYCYACHLFNAEPGKYWETITKNGFRDWKHALGKDGIISCHDNCKTHKEAMVSWHEYVKNTESGTTVDKRIDASRTKTIYNNRHYLKADGSAIRAGNNNNNNACIFSGCVIY